MTQSSINNKFSSYHAKDLEEIRDILPDAPGDTLLVAHVAVRHRILELLELQKDP